MKPITELGDCYPTYEQCVELEKYRKRATFAQWYKGIIANEICIEYYNKNGRAESNEELGCPSVPEMEEEVRELQKKHGFSPVLMAWWDKEPIEFGTYYDGFWFYGYTLATAYAALLLELYAEYEPISPTP